MSDYQYVGFRAVDRPVSEKVAEERQTDFFLRSDLQIVDVLPGEPDGQGSQRRVKGRFTLVTKGNVSSPKLMVRGEGGALAPNQVHVNRVGREPWHGNCAISLWTHRYGLRLITTQRKRDGELAAGLDPELAGGTTVLA